MDGVKRERKRCTEGFPGFRDFAFDSWTAKYGRAPAWGKAELNCIKQAHSRIGEEARERWLLYLKDDQPWLRGHNPRSFIYHLDRWIPEPPPVPVPDDPEIKGVRAIRVVHEAKRIMRTQGLPFTQAKELALEQIHAEEDPPG